MTYPFVTVPIDFDLVRKTIANEGFRVTKVPFLLAEPTVQGAPRPELPYFTFKLVTPAAKSGDDSQYHVSGTTYGRGGVRKMTVGFQCYAQEQEQAYSLMCLWQGSLELFATQENLRRAGIAVWVIGNVADLSQLLNTGYEGRAQLDTTFGIASNLVEDLGEIDTAEVTGTTELDTGTDTETFTVP